MRPDGKARRVRIPGVFERGATPPGGMQRRPNAAGRSPRAVRSACLVNGSWSCDRSRAPVRIASAGGMSMKEVLVKQMAIVLCVLVVALVVSPLVRIRPGAALLATVPAIAQTLPAIQNTNVPKIP